MMSKELVVKNGISYCPKCNSKKITECLQAVLHKENDYNTGKTINPTNGTFKMTNKEKANAYDNACGESIGCWCYKCRKCGWISELYTE